jgi:CheY-like chemotaxis protein
MGGRIWLTSKEREGSTFWISLPIKEAFIPQSEPASTLVKKKDAGSITILAAEDELSNFIFLETILLKASYNLLHAHNGQEALDMVKENPNIDLILMDIKMPVMDGYEAFRQIRAVNTSVPVIALTAFAMADEAAKIKNAGFNDYLTKPYKRAELLNIINLWS